MGLAAQYGGGLENAALTGARGAVLPFPHGVVASGAR